MEQVIETPTALFDSLDLIKSSTLSGHVDTKYGPDFQHAIQFLYSYRGSKATFTAYRRELERFLQWCWLVKEKPLPCIKREDIEEYVGFCQKPPLDWIATQNVPRFIESASEGRVANPNWRPFVVSVSKVSFEQGEKADPKKYFLSKKALQSIFAVLSSFYNYLLQEDYVDFNPVAQIRQKSKYFRSQQTTKVIRRLSELQCGYVIETIEKLAAKQPEVYERSLFVMNALLGMYLRISELVANEQWSPQMGDFFIDHDGNWWFKTVGKGNKQRIVAVSDSMLIALKRYRKFLNLPSLPTPGETTPLLSKQRGQGPVTSTRNVRYLVQDCFNKAIEKLLLDGFQDEAEQLKVATVHWLRHTGISEGVKTRPREHVRDDAGHSSSAITDQYIDVELRERHASGKNKAINPFEGIDYADE